MCKKTYATRVEIKKMKGGSTRAGSSRQRGENSTMQLRGIARYGETQSVAPKGRNIITSGNAR